MTDAFQTETVTNNGNDFMIEYFSDYSADAPWDRENGHGPVSEWTSRSKRPGERVLNESRGGSYRYYDFQEAVKIAKRDWVSPNGIDSFNQIAANAVEADFQRLKGWCNDDWHYQGIVVTLLNEDGEKTEFSESLWGIESDCDDYHKEVIGELIQELNLQISVPYINVA